MSNHTNDILFEYLRSILYDHVTEPLDLSQIDDEFLDLAKGLQVLDQCVDELKQYTKPLSTGNLSIEFPAKNPLCMNLKNLHSNLNHLTWQAQQVARGDYNQKVSYLGDFSVAFNQMTEQLKERESLLKKEHSRLQEQAKLAQSYNNMLKNLSKRRKEWIFILDLENQQITYCNHNNDQEAKPEDICKNCSKEDYIRPAILSHDYSDHKNEWQLEDERTGRFYSVNTFDIVWEGAKSRAHIVEDISDFKREEKHLSDLVYIDAKTGLYNHRFIKERLNYYIGERINFSLAFVDIDGLKEVNDNYGHSEGDNYINFIVTSIQSILRPVDTFARIGGDEFLIVFVTCSKSVVSRRLESLYNTIKKHSESPDYKRGFSFGIVEYDTLENVTLDALIDQADSHMYKCKLAHKAPDSV